MSATVPDWLCGVWSRTWIRRAGMDGLGEPDSSVEVRYIQTPWAFVDVRSPHDASAAGTMAFGGITQVSNENGRPPLVSWHAVFNLDPPVLETGRGSIWAAADADTPRPTDDCGYFERRGENEVGRGVYHEWDPEGTLEERWVQLEGGSQPFLAARLHARALVVVVGSHFGLVVDERPANDALVEYVAGRVTPKGWLVELRARHDSLLDDRTAGASPKPAESEFLFLPGKAGEWELLRGSSLSWGDLPPAFESDEQH